MTFLKEIEWVIKMEELIIELKGREGGRKAGISEGLMNRNELVGSMPATNWIISASLKNSTERNR